MSPAQGSSPWNSAEMVAGFSQSPPNATLISLAAAELGRDKARLAVDIGCGAARNAVPLARVGWNVIGIDASRPMLDAAVQRGLDEPHEGRLLFAHAPMDALPVAGRTADLIVAHGVWNLATSDAEFRTAVREAARIARPGAALFVFTFSRHTLPPSAAPLGSECFVFTQFSGQPQCFVTAAQLIEELGREGFALEPALPLREHNLPPPGAVRMGGPPVIYEAAFRFRP